MVTRCPAETARGGKGEVVEGGGMGRGGKERKWEGEAVGGGSMRGWGSVALAKGGW